jgi:serine/threonine-protein kinase
VAAVAGISALGYFVMPASMRGRLNDAVARLGGGAPSERQATVGPAADGAIMAAGMSGFVEVVSPDTAAVTAPQATNAEPADSAAPPPAQAPSAAAASDISAAPPAPETIPAASQPRDERTVGTGQATESDARQNAAGAPASTGSAPRREEKAESRKTGWLAISSEPAAEVYIDGVYFGDTPLGRLELAAGGHSLELVSPKHENYSERVSIVAGELSSRNVSLQKLVGRVSLSTIDGAEVYLDGVLVGVTPLSGPLELDTGRHQLTVKKAGYHVWNNTITIEARQILPLKITLSPIF